MASERGNAVEVNHDATVVGVAIAGIVSVVVTEDDWDLFDSMVGLVLLLVLLAYGRFRRQAVASRWEAAATGAVFAFCVILVLGPLIDELRGWTGWPPAKGVAPELDGFWFFAIWVALSTIFAVLLRAAGERLVHPVHRRPAGPDGAEPPP